MTLKAVPRILEYTPSPSHDNRANPIRTTTFDCCASHIFELFELFEYVLRIRIRIDSGHMTISTDEEDQANSIGIIWFLSVVRRDCSTHDELSVERRLMVCWRLVGCLLSVCWPCVDRLLAVCWLAVDCLLMVCWLAVDPTKSLYAKGTHLRKITSTTLWFTILGPSPQYWDPVLWECRTRKGEYQRAIRNDSSGLRIVKINTIAHGCRNI